MTPVPEAALLAGEASATLQPGTDLSVAAQTAARLADALRAVMRAVPQPVTLVTSVHRGEGVGAVIGSFTSVSLDPPLFSFNLQRGSALREAIEAGAPFAVHVLAADQADLARRFSRPGVIQAVRFEGIDGVDADGVPVLPALARLRGRCHARISAGDHLLVIADVVSVEHGDTDVQNGLAYAHRAFGTVQPNGPG